MDIGDWLRSLGLERYERAFIDNAVDTDVLPELTESDLEKLGLALGDRKRLRTESRSSRRRDSRPSLVPSAVTSR
ncbi:MAG: adenylate/guanylate cyclase [Microvirga sp.]|nr:adenylate/guanylate cyclase [Microvirga sp.]